MRLSGALLSSAFTFLNMFCGYLALIQIMNDKFEIASWLILLAGVFDAIDGKIARRSRKSSRLGLEIDSLADVISFGLAPSFLIYRGYSSEWIMVGALIAFVPIVSASIRLARYNLSSDAPPTRYFHGLSSPAAGIAIVSFVLFDLRLYGRFDSPKFVIPLVFVLSFLMLSSVEFDKFPLLTFREGGWNSFKLVGVVAGFTLLYFFKGLALFPIALTYLLVGFFGWIIRRVHEEQEEDSVVRHRSK